MLKTKATWINLYQSGHSVSEVRITILEKMKNSDKNYRKERGTYLINKIDIYYIGNNRMPYKVLSSL